MDPEFVIVGGGIGGMVLAKLLARGGKRVLVVERSADPIHVVRPEVLWPVTANFLRELLQPAHPEAWLVPLVGIGFSLGREHLFESASESFLNPVHQPQSSDPNVSRALLAEGGDFELRRGVEVVDVLRSGGRIAGVRVRDLKSGSLSDISAEWTVADDGSHSKLRELMGIGAELHDLPIELFVTPFDWPASLPPARVQVWGDPEWHASGILGLAAIAWPLGKGVLLAPVRPRAFQQPDTLRTAWAELVDRAPQAREIVGSRQLPDDLFHIHLAWGHADKYSVPGGVLIGDAAHPVSPAGGQGANMAVADARAMAELILMGARDWPAAYEQRRRPANHRSLQFTRQFTRVLNCPEFITGVVAKMAREWVSRHPERFDRLLDRAATSFQDRKADAAA